MLKIFIRLFILGGMRLAVNDLDVSGQYVRRMEMAFVLLMFLELWILVTLGLCAVKMQAYCGKGPLLRMGCSSVVKKCQGGFCGRRYRSMSLLGKSPVKFV